MARGTAQDLVRPAVLVDVTTPLRELRRRLDEPEPPTSFVVVPSGAGQDHRLVQSEALLRASGVDRVAGISCCDEAPLPQDLSLPEAVAAALSRPQAHRGHDLLVRTEGGFGVVLATDLLRAQATQYELVETSDALTGLPTRASIVSTLQRALASPGPQVACAFIDLDGFKDVNDRHGHLAGDRVLRVVGQRLSHGLRDGDVAGRFGGDEFIVVMRVRDADEARHAIERLRERIVAPIDLDASRVSIGMSAGVALGRPGRMPSEALVADADALMYLAKQQGGGVLVGEQGGGSGRVVTRSSLADALLHGRLALHYQPIVPLDGTPSLGAEALVRWPRSDGTMMPPGSFIPLAESTGQIVDLDWWAIETVVHQLVAWDAAGLGEPVTTAHVNLSGRTLSMPGVVTHVGRMLDRAGLSPERLTLEITETAVVADSDRARDVIHALGRLGVRTAIDDFGVGHSSLAQLSTLPVQCLKIDASFVRRLVEQAVDRSVVKLIRTLADELGLEVVAEGVETRGQAQVLQDLGITHAQGWLWAPARPPAAIGSGDVVRNMPG